MSSKNYFYIITIFFSVALLLHFGNTASSQTKTCAQECREQGYEYEEYDSCIRRCEERRAQEAGDTGREILSSNYGLPDPPGGIRQIVQTFLVWLLGIFGFLALISFIVSGIQYILAAGNENDMQTAKRNMTYSILGVIVALAGVVIIQAIDLALRGMTGF